jgi:hypothetical protein
MPFGFLSERAFSFTGILSSAWRLEHVARIIKQATH